MQQSPGIWVSILVLYCIYYTSNYSMLLCRYSPIVLTFCTIFFQLTSFPVGLLIILHLHLDRAYPSKCHAALRLRAGRLGIEVKASRVERWPQGTRVGINGLWFLPIVHCQNIKDMGFVRCFGVLDLEAGLSSDRAERARKYWVTLGYLFELVDSCILCLVLPTYAGFLLNLGICRVESWNTDISVTISFTRAHLNV